MSRIYVLAMVWLAAAATFYLVSGGGAALDHNGGKVLHLALDTEPKTLDPIGITDTLSDGVGRKCYNALLRLDRNENGELVVVGDLAESYDISPDGLVYTFKMRPGVKFHNGREVTAQDAAYSLTRLLTPQSKRAIWLKPMVKGSTEYTVAVSKMQKDGQSSATPNVPLGISAVDKQTLRIELTEPFAPFVHHLCTVNCSIVAREGVEDESKLFSRNPIGTGPFKLAKWRHLQSLTFVRHDEYFRGKPKLDVLEFLVVKERSMQLEQFMAGALDAALIPYGQVTQTITKVGDENILGYDTMRTNYIGIGMPNGEFAKPGKREKLVPLGGHKLVRQAIAYAIDRDYLCDKVLQGRGKPAKSILPPGMPGYDPNRKGYPRDLDKARALLKEAGFPGGKGIPQLTLLHRHDEDTRLMAQAIQHDLTEIGIQAELQAREWGKFLEMSDNEPQPFFLLGWVADYPDPDNFLHVLFNSKSWGSGCNITWYQNAEVDELTDRARKITDMAERAKLYHRVEDILLDECPWVVTYNVRNLVCLSNRVKGIRERVTPLDTGIEFPQVDFAFVDKE